MTLQQLKYADAVATCGSISEAARRVFVTQPTLTESIRALEEELRTAIFTRSARGIVVTREGEEFLILGLNGFTVASGALSRDLNGPDVIAVPLKMDEIIRVGLVTQSDVPLSAAGKIFEAAIRRSCAERSYDDAGL